VGAPKKINRNFYCSRNLLTNLEGAPQYVDGDFDCSNNGLTSLKGAPKWVGGDFECNTSGLTSLAGAPDGIGGRMVCGDNLLEKETKIRNLTKETMITNIGGESQVMYKRVFNREDLFFELYPNTMMDEVLSLLSNGDNNKIVTRKMETYYLDAFIIISNDRYWS
jgi:hypothetical protein